MNIGQIMRNQQMLYAIANKSVDMSGSGYSPKPASSSSKLSAYSSLLNGFGSSAQDTGDNFFSSPAALQGTVRQIARRVYDASFSSGAIAGEDGTGSVQGSGFSGGDELLKAIQKQLGTKVESQRQIYQPDQTGLTGDFAQLQAVAESAVSRLQTVSLSGETTKKIQALALEDAKSSAGGQGNGEADTPTASRADRMSMIQDEVQKFAPSRRAAALNTINRVWQNELDRIGEHIKEKDSNWTLWGDQFDVSILDDYKAGVNVWA